MTALRPAERILLAYFAYTVAVSVPLGGLSWRVALMAGGVVVVIWIVTAISPQPSRFALRLASPGSRFALRLASPAIRDWLPLALVPVAYWQIDLVRRPAAAAVFARRWLPVDAWLLRHAHAESWGPGASIALETAYALTYAIPPAAVAILYVVHCRDRVDRFHRIFFSGTLVAYGLLPFFPSASPRLVDPAGWQPPMNAMRHFNIWLLDHLDIHSSVFPSGHVAASFSAAFGLFSAFPERKRIASALLVLALLIGVATVYGRYHYAVDVVASIAITVIVWRILARACPAEARGEGGRGGLFARRGPSVVPAGPRSISMVVLAAMLSFTASRAAAADVTLSPAEQLTIARAFAPVLVFHPDEEYFPLNSRDGVAAAGELEAVRDRVAKYSAMPRDDRLALGAIGYRVFPRVNHGSSEIVVEYWCHYLYNAYTVRVGWLPYRVRDNHPEDLERLYLVLTPTPSDQDEADHDAAWARRSFRIRRVVANAHDGSVPPNQYDADIGAPITLPLTILVERGSHAMAPDINNDGRFTPSIDSTATGKLLWGIRDGGKLWGWYRSSYMDMRDQTAVRLCANPASSERPCVPYTLYPVTDLQRWFDGLQLSSRERVDVVGRTSWVTRVFGDVRVEDLMVPADPPDGSMLDRMLSRRTRTEEGFEAGFTTVGSAPAFVAGKRFFWNVPSRRMPDVIADVSAIIPSGRRTQLQATLTGSYALDATTNVIAGAGWFSDDRPNGDGVVGFDIRIGRFHVQPLHRLRQDGFHVNLVALF